MIKHLHNEMYKSQLGEYSSQTETYTSVRVFRVHNQLENYLINKKKIGSFEKGSLELRLLRILSYRSQKFSFNLT